MGGEAVFEELLAIPCTVVWGNTDLPDPSLIAYMGELGLAVPDGFPKMLSLDGKRFAVFHGHEPEFEHALRTLGVDYVLHGHSHQVRDERLHGKRVINPGALHRVRRKTVAVLETDTDELTFHEIRGA